MKTKKQEIKVVSPTMAEEWLNLRFEHQRSLRQHHVLLLAQEMEAGNFIPHSHIVFADYAGKRYLIDGQHRLEAVTLFAEPVEMSILTLEAGSMEEIRQAYGSIDQGLKRTTIDAVRAQGLAKEIDLSERHVGRLTGAVRLIAAGFADATNRKDAAKASLARTRSNAVVSELARNWGAEARLYFSLIHDGEPANRYLFDRAPVIACALLTLRYVPEKAKDFWLGMAADDGLSRDDPRKRLLIWLREKKEAGKATNVARAFSIAWRAFLDGKELDFIRISDAKGIAIREVPLQDEAVHATERVAGTEEGEASPAPEPVKRRAAA